MGFRAFVVAFAMVLGTASDVLAAGEALHVHPLAAAPFALLLAAIAGLPLIAGHWWHSNRNRAIVVVVFAVPTAVYLLSVANGTAALAHELEEYATFIILLTALYTVSGGVVLRGSLQASTRVNVGILALGAVLANLIGTTGASMLLIRPILRANAHRFHRVHVPVFFIFVVSNTGGLLTPLGDPPLFLGFLQGVPFTWTLQLWPQWLFVNGLLLAVFTVWDRVAIRREQARASQHVWGELPTEPLRLDGWRWNGPLMLGVVGAVLLKKYLPFPVGELIMVACAAASLWKTPKLLREENGFVWGPMVEVAVLFVGIFVTMVPALALLTEHGGKLGVTRPWEFFWITGLLSSLLDNAPTYLTMATLAAGGQDLAGLSLARPNLLAAISCGAVFMGANSYIGNGPNFMVKAIAEESRYHMPSFFGYVLYALLIQIPILIATTIIFFRG